MLIWCHKAYPDNATIATWPKVAQEAEFQTRKTASQKEGKRGGLRTRSLPAPESGVDRDKGPGRQGDDGHAMSTSIQWNRTIVCRTEQGKFAIHPIRYLDAT